MDRTERFHRIDRLLRQPGGIAFESMRQTLEVSRSTLVRDLQYLRDRFNAPIDWHRDTGRYCYRQGERFALPGLWLSAAELEALLVFDHLLTELRSDLFGPALRPLRDRLQRLIDERLPRGLHLAQRVRLFGGASARDEPVHFNTFARATLERRRLWIRHHHRDRDERSEREISPQRLVRYRDNWYCDAWCHRRNALRSFALDAVEDARLLERCAAAIPAAQLDAKLGAGYGIFKGRSKHTARLRFSVHAARWVSRERWHPQQRGRWLAGGRYELQLPYTDARELVMDILRHGPEVEVLGPPALRQALIAGLDTARAIYAPTATGSSPEPVASQTHFGTIGKTRARAKIRS